MSLRPQKVTKNCIHSRKIQSFVANPDHSKFTIFKKHLDHCSICQKELVKEHELVSGLEGMVPFRAPLESQLLDIKRELQESLHGLEVVDRTSYRFKFKLKSSSLVEIFFNTAKNLFRPKHGVWMIFALIFSYIVAR